jgi:hypothetical protein
MMFTSPKPPLDPPLCGLFDLLNIKNYYHLGQLWSAFNLKCQFQSFVLTNIFCYTPRVSSDAFVRWSVFKLEAARQGSQICPLMGTILAIICVAMSRLLVPDCVNASLMPAAVNIPRSSCRIRERSVWTLSLLPWIEFSLFCTCR